MTEIIEFPAKYTYSGKALKETDEMHFSRFGFTYTSARQNLLDSITGAITNAGSQPIEINIDYVLTSANYEFTITYTYTKPPGVAGGYATGGYAAGGYAAGGYAAGGYAIVGGIDGEIQSLQLPVLLDAILGILQILAPIIIALLIFFTVKAVSEILHSPAGTVISWALLLGAIAGLLYYVPKLTGRTKTKEAG